MVWEGVGVLFDLLLPEREAGVDYAAGWKTYGFDAPFSKTESLEAQAAVRV